MSLHVMYYRPFDRSMGLRIINEFFELTYNACCPDLKMVIMVNNHFFFFVISAVKRQD